MATGGLKGLAKGRSDLFRMDPSDLHIKKGWNGRDFDDPENKAHVESLAMSIEAVGVKEPLTVCWEDNKAYVTNGECRLRAVRLLISRGTEVKTVPVQNEDRFGNEADRLFSQVVRNSGKPFTPMEQAKVFKRLLDLGWAQADIAVKSGVTPSRVSQALNLLTLPEPIKAMVTAGQVSAAMAAKTVATAPSKQAAVETLKEAVKTAKAEGKTKATPKHLNGGKNGEGDIEILDDITLDDTAEDTKAEAKARARVDKVVFEAFEYAKVDDEVADDKGRPVVVITMPLLHWEKIRNVLKL